MSPSTDPFPLFGSRTDGMKEFDPEPRIWNASSRLARNHPEVATCTVAGLRQPTHVEHALVLLELLVETERQLSDWKDQRLAGPQPFDEDYFDNVDFFQREIEFHGRVYKERSVVTSMPTAGQMQPWRLRRYQSVLRQLAPLWKIHFAGMADPLAHVSLDAERVLFADPSIDGGVIELNDPRFDYDGWRIRADAAAITLNKFDWQFLTLLREVDVSRFLTDLPVLQPLAAFEYPSNPAESQAVSLWWVSEDTLFLTEASRGAKLELATDYSFDQFGTFLPLHVGLRKNDVGRVRSLIYYVERFTGVSPGMEVVLKKPRQWDTPSDIAWQKRYQLNDFPVFQLCELEETLRTHNLG